MSIVLDLQKDIIQNKKTLTELLREALLISTKLKLDDFKVWINSELKGYISTRNIPDYRILQAELKLNNPYRGWMPILTKNGNLIDTLHLIQPISELEDLSNKSEEGILYASPSNKMQHIVYTQIEFNFECKAILHSTQIIGIIEQVKTALLEWTFKLEENQILGDENMSFSNEEQEKAQQTIHIKNFNGNWGNIESLGNLSTGNHNYNTTTINNGIDTKVNELIKKIDTLDISNKSQIIQEIEENKNDKGKLTQILGQLMTRGSEIATVLPAIGELLGMLG